MYMKKFLLLFLLTCVSYFTKAQDMIVKKDGSIVKAKVLEVNDDDIKYKKVTNLDGPIYTISKSNLISINYANGQVEKFESSAKTIKKNEDEDVEKEEKQTIPKPASEYSNLKITAPVNNTKVTAQGGDLKAQQRYLQQYIYTAPDKLTVAKDLVELTEKAFTPKDQEYYDGYYTAGICSYKNPRESIKYLEVAVDAYKKNYTGYPNLSTDAGLTNCLLPITSAYRMLGLISTAIEVLESNKEFIKKFSNHTRCVFYYTLGDLYSSNEEYSKAILQYSYMRRNLDSGEPMIHVNKTDPKWKQDMNIKLESIFRETIEMNYALSMGNVYYFRQQYDSALPYMKKGIEISEKFVAQNKKNVANQSNSALGRENIQYHKFSEEMGGSYLGLVTASYFTGKKQEALTYAKGLKDKALYYQLNSEFEKSEIIYKEMLAKASKFNNTTAYKWAEPHWTNLLKPGYLTLQCAKQNYDFAIPEFKKELEKDDKAIQEDFAYFSENEKKEYFKQYNTKLNRYYSLLLSYAEKNPPSYLDILDKSIQTKGLVMDATNEQENRFKNITDKDLLNDIDAIKEFREKLNAFTQLNSGDSNLSLDDSIAKYSLSINLTQKKINAKLGAPTNIFKPLNWKSIQQKLKPTETFVEIIKIQRDYFQFAQPIDQYWVFIIKDTGTPITLLLGEGKEFEYGMQTYQNQIWSEKEDSLSYDLYWKKIAQQLNGKTKIFLCSDGIFQLINPLTLKNPQTKKYVFDDIELVRVATGRDLFNTKSPAGEINKSVLVGNPNFNMSRKSINAKIQTRPVNLGMVSAKRSGYSALPGTEREINAISTYAKTKGIELTLLQGDNASEVNVKKINNPEILHLATHGAFDATGSGDSYLKSKLLLSGAGDAEPFTIEDYAQYEDGYLTAYEVTQMNLATTKLVVLSACETGLGDVQSGEGVWGLQRAFQVAGARNVLSSLWAISDDATAIFMTSFYKAYYNKLSIKLSYLTAMKETRKIYPHPYYWGAFVLTGFE